MLDSGAVKDRALLGSGAVKDRAPCEQRNEGKTSYRDDEVEDVEAAVVSETVENDATGKQHRA